MKTELENIVLNIIKIRNDRGFTQAAVAQGINVDYSTYSKIESKQIKLTVERLDDIASFYRLRIIDIITYPVKYIPIDNSADPANARMPKVILQVELDEDKKEQILNMIFGSDLRIL